ncbi:MAG: photosystem reaction center subunit H [Chloroflexi bacterium]|nr:photosystem reaction center subunit H [Chloroflexota bacterium]
MKAKELFGKQVIDANAKVVGKIVDVGLDIEEATINGILVKKGWAKKVSISPRNIDRIGDKVLLKVTKDRKKKI